MFEQAMKKKTLIKMLMLQASKSTTLTRNNLDLFQQKQPKISLKARFSKIGQVENVAARVTCFELV
jgi:hypothetical protein